MELGISSYTYTWSVGIPGSEPPVPWDEKTLVHKAADLGVDRLQVADNLPLHTFGNERLAELKRLSREKGIIIEVGARGMTPGLLETYLQVTEFLGSSLLRFILDGEGFRPTVDEAIRIIRRVTGDLGQKKIRLAIENHDRLKAREFREIIEGVGCDQVGICLDSVNSMGAGEGIETITHHVAPYVFNLHVKEFLVQRHPHMMGFTIEGRPIGQGQLPLRWMLEQLGPQCESAILEQWTPPEADLSATMEKEQRWAEEGISYLKTNYFH